MHKQLPGEFKCQGSDGYNRSQTAADLVNDNLVYIAVYQVRFRSTNGNGVGNEGCYECVNSGGDIFMQDIYSRSPGATQDPL